MSKLGKVSRVDLGLGGGGGDVGVIVAAGQEAACD